MICLFWKKFRQKEGHTSRGDDKWVKKIYADFGIKVQIGMAPEKVRHAQIENEGTVRWFIFYCLDVARVISKI